MSFLIGCLLLYSYLIYYPGLGEEEGFARRLQGGPLELVFFHTTSCGKATRRRNGS